MAQSAALPALAAKYQMIGKLGAASTGAFSSLIGANASSRKQYKYQSALQAQAAKLNYDYSLKSAENMPTYTRKGLESAGYNPMLAVQNSTSGANSSWTSPGNATAPDYSGAISSGVANAQSFQRLKNETEQAESSSDANYAQADKLKAEKAEISARLPFVSKRQRAEISKLEADAQLAEATKHNLKERLELDRYLGLLGIDVKQVANANQADYIRILEKSMPSGRSQSFENYTSGARNIMSGIGDIIHGSNNYENYSEQREVTNGPNGRSSEKVTSKRSGRRKKR